jgi:photosystem II stability/assembly factor-like uncharacterized protein
LHSIHFPDATHGYAAGKYGVVVGTTDGGLHWVQKPSTLVTQRTLLSVYFPSDSVGFAVGQGGVIIRTINAGATWDTLASGTKRSLFSVLFTDTQNGWATGEQGMILMTSNGGVTWTKQPSGTRSYMYASARTPSGTGWTVGRSATILKYSAGPLNVPAASPEVPRILSFTNFPNPFNPRTTISFDLEKAAVLSIKIYNILGQEVALLADRQEFSAGNHVLEFDAGKISSGLYFCRISLPDGKYQAARKMLYLK